MILFHLRQRPYRFSVLRRSLPQITQRMLSLSLRDLERDGIISRTVEPTVPPQVSYALTAKGRSLDPILTAMADWGQAELSARDAGR